MYPTNDKNKQQLTKRETEIKQLVTEGYCSKEIAVKLSIRKATVDNHRKNVLRKARAKSATELTQK